MEHPPPAVTDDRPWWGTFPFEAEGALTWQVGPLTLWVHAAPYEWKVIIRRDPDPLGMALEPARPVPPEAVTALLEAPDVEISRYSRPADDAALSLIPMPADRTVIVRPDLPFFVQPEQEAKLFVSSPLWIVLRSGASQTPLLDTPTFRLSDTWFGPSTLKGELCYATVTGGRLNLDRLPFRPHRATTPIVIRNRTPEPLRLERVRLPAPYLSLYLSDRGFLWTNTVRLDRGSTDDLATLSIDRTPPPEAGPTRLVTPPRLTATRDNLLVHAFSSLFNR